ncbi:RHS repeat-associated core domain-containing protein [Dysgonomonas alginatilytica]|nr:RHS repeat-associated core domain-containing protein [Dysgonomonas alginatilytica]
MSESTNEGAQLHKYNGKELDRDHELNWYDYSARQLDNAIGRFTTMDPHSENYYSWSSYVYVGNNPMKYIDPDGKDWREALNKFRQSVSASVSIGIQAGVELTLNKTGVSANVNIISKDLGGISEGENAFNLADPTTTQSVSLEVGKWALI